MHQVNAIRKLSELQVKENSNFENSWHKDFKHSCYVYVGGLDYRLTEGDICVVFSQWGEPIDINLIRDKKTGVSKGFCFIGYEDQRSTDLCVDNANGMLLLNRVIKVNHVDYYRPPKAINEKGEEIEYQPTGAEGLGIGVSKLNNQNKCEENFQKKDKTVNYAGINKELLDPDYLWSLEFDKKLKMEKEERMKKKVSKAGKKHKKHKK